MNKAVDRRILLAVAGVVALIVLAVALPLPGPSEESNSDRLVVAVTMLPQAGFVEAIGGDKVDVLVMVPPGASPHTYEVTPDQMVKLSKAKLYAKVGSPVEFELAFMDNLMAANQAMLVVDCSQGIQLVDMDEHHHDDEEHHGDDEHHHEDEDHHHGDDEHHHDDDDHHHHTGPDPHIWLSVRNAMIMVQNICAGLVQVDPANKAYYEANCAAYLQQLQELDDEISVALAGVQNRRFIVFHPAWGYFARDYDLIQIAVEQGGKEPDAQYQMRLIDEAREHDIRVMFVSPQFAARSAEVIAREIYGEVVIINPLAKDFLDNMRAVASAMKQAMK